MELMIGSGELGTLTLDIIGHLLLVKKSMHIKSLRILLFIL